MTRRFLPLTIVLVLAGCGGLDLNKLEGKSDGGAQATPTYTPIVINGRACPTGNLLTYENFGQGFLTSNCTGCHSSALPAGSRQNAPVTVNFDTYDQFRLNAATAFADAADLNTRMPIAANLPLTTPYDQSRLAFGDWIACNAPTDAMLQGQ